ncbi:MAG: methyl-accepting chemotaxis protein [Pseudomonadota bacterium]
MIFNLCIGLLMYINITAFFQIESRTNDLLDVNASMNEHLRASIFDLQKKYLEIPKLLETDTAEKITNWIKTRFSSVFVKEEQIRGAEKYRQFFNRSQRRDISKGRFVVQSENEQIFVSKGILNKDGSSSETISRIQLASQFPEQDISRINAQIEIAAQAGDSEDALKQRVLVLKSQLADDALAAETSRNEILYKIEDIQKQKTALIQYRQEKRNTIAGIAILAIVINLVMLHLMARFVVEKPLKQLTQTIEAINCGQTIRIPFQGRKDRIGILAGAIKDFQGALTNLQKEDQRKKMERIVIQELIEKMSGFIDGLQKKATAMKETARELSGLAADTEDHTHGATRSASKTVEQTDTVSTSTRQLQSAAADISIQISKQNELISDINDVTRTSREDICELTKASEQITGIIKMVKNIAKETKLLALNAKIEAARSGEAGKGFAVVAGEVRELSIQTEVANADIAEKIKSIQQVSHIIIENTKKIEARITNLMDASFQISAAVEQQTGTTAGIARNAQATSHDIKDVSDKITKVTQAAQSTSRFAQTVQSLSENIAIELSALLNETRDKLSMISLSDTCDAKPVEPDMPVSRKNAA